jgi:hypothetical protein
MVFGQTESLTSLENYLDELADSTTAVELSKSANKKTCNVRILSNPSLDKLFAKKMAYYLSGGTDVSIFRNYAKFETAEGKATLGFNFMRPKDDNNYISRIYNIGLVTDKLGSIFTDKKTANNIGLSFNLTFLSRGTINTGKDCSDMTVIQEMNNKRAFLKESIKNLARNEVNEFKRLQLNNPNFQSFTAKELEDFEDDLYKKYRDKFTEDELDYAKTRIKGIRKSFISVGGYLPFMGNDYKFVNNKDTNTVNFKPFDFYIKYNRFWEGKVVNWFLVPTLGAKAFNAASLFTLFSDLDNSTGKTSLNSTFEVKYDKTNDIYTSSSSNFYLGYFGLKAIVTFNAVQGNWVSSFAVAPSYNQYFGKYTTKDLGLDFIFGLPSQDEKGISVDLAFKFMDISDNIVSKQNKSNYFAVSMGLAVPLSKLAY